MAYSVETVARAILDKTGRVSALKLQKLMYYAQAWSLVWDGRPLVHEEIQAWAFGPVCPVLYQKHRGKYFVVPTDFQPKVGEDLDTDSLETLDAVIDHYGQMKAHGLSQLSHIEEPWKQARGDLPLTARSNHEISHASMAEYYGSLS